MSESHGQKSKESLSSIIKYTFRKAVSLLVGANMMFSPPVINARAKELINFHIQVSQYQRFNQKQAEVAVNLMQQKKIDKYTNYANEQLDKILEYYSDLTFIGSYREGLITNFNKLTKSNLTLSEYELVPENFQENYKKVFVNYYEDIIQDYKDEAMNMFNSNTNENQQVQNFDSIPKNIKEIFNLQYMQRWGILPTANFPNLEEKPKIEDTIDHYTQIIPKNMNPQNNNEFRFYMDPFVIMEHPELFAKYNTFEQMQSDVIGLGLLNKFEDLRVNIQETAPETFILREKINVNESERVKKEKIKKTLEYRAEMLTDFTVEFLKDCIKNDADEIIFADRGARPFGQVAEYLFSKFKDKKDLPKINYFKLTNQNKLVDALTKINSGFDSSKSPEIADEIIMNAFKEKFAYHAGNEKLIIADDWITSGKTKNYAIKILKKLGYDFNEKQFQVFVEGPGDKKNKDYKMIPKTASGERLLDWRDILDFHGKQLEIGIEYGIDRVNNGDSTIPPNKLFEEFDINKGIHRIDSTQIELKKISKKNIIKNSKITRQYLVSNYNLINSVGTLPEEIENKIKFKLHNALMDSYETQEDLKSKISTILKENSNHLYDINEITEHLITFSEFYRSDINEIYQSVERIIETYSETKNEEEFNTKLSELVTNQYQNRLKRGVDIYLEKYGAEQIFDYIMNKKNEIILDTKKKNTIQTAA